MVSIIVLGTYSTRSSAHRPFPRNPARPSPISHRSGHHPTRPTPSPASPREMNGHNAFTTFCQNPRSVFDVPSVINEAKSGENSKTITLKHKICAQGKSPGSQCLKGFRGISHPGVLGLEPRTRGFGVNVRCQTSSNI